MFINMQLEQASTGISFDTINCNTFDIQNWGTFTSVKHPTPVRRQQKWKTLIVFTKSCAFSASRQGLHIHLTLSREKLFQKREHVILCQNTLQRVIITR